VGGQGNHTHEQVIGVRHIATHSKEFHQIMELAVYVAAYLSNVSAYLREDTRTEVPIL
jgi:hypothetical protein